MIDKVVQYFTSRGKLPVKRYIAQSRDLFNEKQVSTTFTSKSCNDLKTIYFEGPEPIKVSATSFKMVHEQSSVLRPISVCLKWRI